jgi:hypothetical protein
MSPSRIQFVLLPEEVFMDSDRCDEEISEVRSNRKEEKLIVIYEHYPLTLGD